MGQPLKVVQFGLGPFGQGVARLVPDTPALKLVGAIDIDPNRIENLELFKNHAEHARHHAIFDL